MLEPFISRTEVRRFLAHGVKKNGTGNEYFGSLGSAITNANRLSDCFAPAESMKNSLEERFKQESALGNPTKTYLNRPSPRK